MENKLTIEDVKKWAKPHANRVDGAKQIVLETKDILVSIVGGAQGLYGDFEEDFEVAIIEKKNNDFMTKFFFPDANDDVLPYQTAEDVESIIKTVIGNNSFQVR